MHTRTSRRRWRRGFLVATAVLALAGCSAPAPMQSFAGHGPDLDPVQFFTGHNQSWGVLENRAGQPTGIVTTDCFGTQEGPDRLHMVQYLNVDGKAQVRDWHMQRLGDGRFQATATDMVGTATGEAVGRVFHWTWVLATEPGNSLHNVTMDQWMYLMDDGAVVNRTTIAKLGITLAQVSEQFTPAPAPAAH